MAAINEPAISVDYMAMDKNDINIPKAISRDYRGAFAVVSQGTRTVFQGIVGSTTYSDDRSTTVSLKPLLSLLDVKLYYSGNLTTGSIESHLAAMLNQYYVTTSDTVQKMPNMTVTALTSTTAVKLSSDSKIMSIYNMAVSALSLAGITVDIKINIPQKSITANISNHSGDSITAIDAELKNIIDKNIALRDTYGATNKVTLINKDNESQSLTFYATPYTAPTVAAVEMLSLSSGEVFADKAAARAAELLAAQYTDLIEITVSDNDRLIHDLRIGQPADIYYRGTVIRTILTGSEQSQGVIKYTFGLVRFELSKILQIQRRA